MEIMDLTSVSSAGASGLAGGLDEVGHDEFLQLLVTQMRNQDPLDPITNEDFLAQLAQFSSLEQLTDINAGTQTGLLLQQSVTNSLAPSLIGKDVLIDASTVEIAGGTPVGIHFKLDGEGIVEAQITDAEGNLIRTLEIAGEDGAPLAAGSHDFTWDGLDDEGEPVPDGSYTIAVSAKDGSGNAVPVTSWLRGRVEGVRFAGGGAWVIIGRMEFTLADIVEIREPRSAITAG
ncbi:MAG: flagellar hook assembly protein FlgD [Candidatus Krumholzibacteriota bacterium]|nr:flagellar hook assembly protein FlgD [Candidatus Krumholzibacteriota bacterium]